MLFSPHLAWRDEPLRAALADRIARAACSSTTTPTARPGPSTASAPARGARALVCVTLGTGIGGGLVLDGELYRGAFGIGRRVRAHDRRARRPALRLRQPGLLGDVLLGHRAGPRGPRTGRGRRRSRRIGCSSWPAASLDALTGEVVAAAAREGDPAAIEICADVGRWLGRGLANLAAVLDPDLFVIGGGVSDAR